VQPLLYRHHHRRGHDDRLRHYLLTVVEAVGAPTVAVITCPDGDVDSCDDGSEAAAVVDPTGL
jgi:hypothetical protein